MTQLLFLHSARRLMLVDTCIKFREYSLSGFQFRGREFDPGPVLYFRGE